MLSSVTPVVGVSDATRPLVLLGFIAALFVVATVAVFIGKSRVNRRQAKRLSVDTGVIKGAAKGADASYSDEWLSEARAETDTTPKQKWQDMILGPGSVHDEDSSPVVLAPEIAAQRTSAAQTEAAISEAATSAPSETGNSAKTGPGKHAAPFLVDNFLEEDD